MRKNLLNRWIHPKHGFTLIELLFAFMFLAWGFMRLLEGQANTIRSSRESQGIIIATQLARAKILDCRNDLIKLGFGSSDFTDEGDFDDEAFKDYAWECYGTRIDVPAPNLDALSRVSGQNGGQGGALSTILGPIFSLLATTLGDSARELTTIVRWKLDNEEQEVKLTTHLIDTRIFSSVMSAVSTSISKPNQEKKPGGEQK